VAAMRRNTAAASSVPGCAGLPRRSGANELRHNQQVPSQSVQSPNANNSSLNDMFKVVTTVRVFQQIMTEVNGAESEEDRTVAI
jgi:hypothetical protein